MLIKESRIKLELRFILSEMGYIPLLYYIEELIAEESYELCAVIVEALKEYNGVYHKELPLSLSDEVIERFLAESINGELTLSNVPHYVREIKKRLTENLK